MLRTGMSIIAATAAGLLVFGTPLYAADVPAPLAQAGTRAEHDAAARAYDKEAATLRQKAASHQSDVKVYQSGGNPKLVAGQLARHCESLSKQYAAAATESEALAKLHRDLAANADK